MNAAALFAAGLAGTLVALSLPVSSAPLQDGTRPPQSAAAKAFIPYVDARPVVDALRQALPAELIGESPAALERQWTEWVFQRDRTIRARVARGDEDSLVHLWHYGTSFTPLPPLTARTVARLGGTSAATDLLEQRLTHLVNGLAAPGGNQRLRFARQIVERRGIDLRSPAGMTQARVHLQELRRRVLAEYEEHRRTLESIPHLDPVTALATHATMFRDRGLSSDTSLLPAFAIEQTLDQMKGHGVLAAGSVRRVAIVGPGLDFANKDEGYDFYPEQTIQPFAVMDSLIRLGLAAPEELVVVTFDLSERINRHIEAARERAVAGSSYTMHLPLDAGEQWSPELAAFWQRLGDRIGTEVPPAAPPSSAGEVRTRAVRIPPARVASVVPVDLNIVLERIDPLAAGDRFDLVVATSVLLYYDVFEQELALVNIGRMLRTGGVLLTNTPVPPTPAMKLSSRYTTVVYSERQRDQVFWYERQ